MRPLSFRYPSPESLLLSRSLALFASTLIAAPLAAQSSHPSFAGSWVVDAAKSSADGPLAAPTAGRYTISQVGDSITADIILSYPDGDQALRRVYKVDGKVWVNGFNYQGTDMVLNSTLHWSDAVLVIHTNSDFAGTEVEQNETWTLSADGKTLTSAMTTNVAGNYYAGVTLVLVRK